MQTKRHCFLIGFMGCGKSYWGKRLADRLNLPFIDLDDFIVAQSGKNMVDIFAEKGESGFRTVEKQALHALATFDTAIVATGGGTPCFFDNMVWMNQIGTTIYLKASPTLLADRLQHEKEFRPLLATIPDLELERFIEKKVAERSAFYSQAIIVMDPNQHHILYEYWLENAIKEALNLK